MNPETATKAMSTKKFGAASVFATVVLIVMIMAILVASRYPFLAGIYPIVIAAGVAVACMLEILKNVGKKLLASNKGATMDISEDSDMPAGERLLKTLTMFCWLLGLYLATYLIGFKLATLLFLGSYIFVHTAGSLLRSILVPLAAFIFLYAFQAYLGVYWPVGLLGEILEDIVPILF